MHEGAIRLLIVDERGEVCAALWSALATPAGLAIIDETVHGADLERTAALYGATIAVLGVFGDTLVFLALAQARHAEVPLATVLLLDAPEATTVRAALWFGVAGALARSEIALSLKAVLRSIGQGRASFAPTIIPLLPPPDVPKRTGIGRVASRARTIPVAVPDSGTHPLQRVGCRLFPARQHCRACPEPEGPVHLGRHTAAVIKRAVSVYQGRPYRIDRLKPNADE